MGTSADGWEQGYFVAVVERGVELGVLAVDGYGNVFPEGKAGGAAVVEKLDQMLYGSGFGELDGVALAVEEFLEEAEV